VRVFFPAAKFFGKTAEKPLLITVHLKQSVTVTLLTLGVSNGLSWIVTSYLGMFKTKSLLVTSLLELSKTLSLLTSSQGKWCDGLKVYI